MKILKRLTVRQNACKYFSSVNRARTSERGLPIKSTSMYLHPRLPAKLTGIQSTGEKC